MNSFHYNSFGSPNATRINNPLAESTAIGSPLAQQSDHFRGNQKRKTVSPLNNVNKYRQSSASIEPHVLTNAQSRGIVKRLVTYYDESQSDADKNNKYVYNRVGDFPIVQLKKTEIKRNLMRSSSVRIPQPTKAVFNRDIRAAILQGNSIQLGSNVSKIQPIRMRVNDDSHQIITNHDPLPIDESPQTSKSVLDALEKNCRKRIINEELKLDRNKRVCAPQETVDGPSSREFIPITTQSAKRGRDQTSPKSSGDSPNSQQSKKLRIKNNALLSSLSSSNFLRTYVKPTAASSAITSDEIDRTEQQLKETKVSLPPKKPESSVEPERGPIKPPPKRLYLFNKRFDDSKPIAKRSYSFRDVNDDDDTIKYNFVKPRENTNQEVDLNSLTNVEGERLNMMLAGLSEGFNSPTRDISRDMLDSTMKHAPASISFTTTTTSSTIAPIPTPISASPPTQSSTLTGSLAVPQKTSVVEEKSTPPTTEAPKFTFGATSSASTAVTAPTVSSASTPEFNFSSAPAGVKTTPTSTVDSSKPLISFTPIAKSQTIVTSESVVPTSNATLSAPSIPAPTIGGFTFDGTNDTSKDKKDGTKPSASFTFGASSNSIVPTSSVATAVVPTSTEAVSSVPSFNLKPSANSAFTFGASPLAASTAKTASPNSSGFSFGSTTPAAVGINIISTTGSSFPSITGSALPSITGSSAASIIASVKPSSTPSFSFGSNTAATTSATALPNMAFGAAAPPSVGLASSAGKTLNASLSGINPLSGTSVSLNSSTSFLNKPETTTASGVGFSFGAKDNTATTTGSGFSFGAPAASTVAPTATKTANFSFGGATGSSAFGSTAVTSPPAFGTTNSTTFGAVAMTTAPTFGATASAPTNTFGASTNSAFGQQTFAAPAVTSPPSFGAATNTVTPAFGANPSGFTNFGQKSEQPAANGMFSFGQKTTAQETPASSTFSFGGATGAAGAAVNSNAFTFGQSSAPQPAAASGGIFGRLGDKQPETKSAFAFGGNQQSQPLSTGSMFGGATSPPAPGGNSVFGTTMPATTSTPMFGSNFGQTNSPAQSPFGNQTSEVNKSDSNFNFRGFGNSNPAPSVQASSGQFNFGGNQNNSANSAPNVFGSSTGSNVSASFTFKPSTGTVSSNTAPVFGQSQNPASAPPPFQFGGSQAPASASFNFSGGATNAPNAGGFSSANNSNSGGFNFGAPQSAPVSGAFNFQGAQPAMTPQPTAGGLFSIGTGGQRRPIRQATRRMK